MKTVTRYQVQNPNTVTGYSVQIITTVSTFNQDEFNAVVKHLENTLGTAYVGDICIMTQPSYTVYDESEEGEEDE